MEKKTLVAATLLVVGLLGVSLVAAFPGFSGSQLTDEEREELKERHEAIRTAVQEADYNTWETLMRERLADMEERINPDTFAELQERQANMQAFKEEVTALKESGELDRESLEALREAYGIENFGKGKAYHKGFKQGTRFGHGLHQEA